MKDILKSNEEKLTWLKEYGGAEYFIMFGRLISQNTDIQDAIDFCYYYFKQKQAQNN